jgi:hypothetical protein
MAPANRLGANEDRLRKEKTMIPRLLRISIYAVVVAAAIHVVHAQAPLQEEIDSMPSVTGNCGSRESPPPRLHCELQEAFEKIRTIRVGSTRGDLVKLFHMSGGLSTQRQGTYNYRDSFLIQVDVEFATNGSQARSLSDVITKISRPYIASSVVD